MKHTIAFFLFFNSILAFGQSPVSIDINKTYPSIAVSKTVTPVYRLKLVKDGVYQVHVQQQGVDVVVVLKDNNGKSLVEQDSPNGANGPEAFEFTPAYTGDFYLSIKRLEEADNPDSATVMLHTRKLTATELATRKKIKRELAPENAKNVQTVDIDHFWEAFDNLTQCHTRADSVASFQQLYLDRATDGLIDFIAVREFTAEKFVNAVARFPKFYRSVRANTYEVKKAAPLIEEVFQRFAALYPHFKPFKVCFAIGVIKTGGTVSGKFVLIGTEVTTSTSAVDLSEFNNNAMSKVMADTSNIVQKIKNIVAHECVHTQQPKQLAANAIRCELLSAALIEGAADFIGEQVAGGQINKVAQQYGNAHEKEVWSAFKSEMCSDHINNWLYNYSMATDKPADLGYYVGYRIAQEYYKQAADKTKALVDIIEMDDPVRLLQLSQYDLVSKP